MSKAITRTAGAPLEGFLRLAPQRQVGLLLGLAMVAGLVFAAVVWATRPTMVPVLTGLSERDTAEAMETLSRSGFQFRLEPGSGVLMVPAGKLHEARIRLATEGLPRSASSSFENLGRDTGFGTSRMVETARYHHALESELARSISTLHGVSSARVHLALPRPTVFLRDRTNPTASVLVNLHPGRQLDDSQLAGIVHLVASSVPELEAERVTVVDQRGRLLTAPNTTTAGLTGRDLDYVQRLEESYQRRITELLTPILGPGGFRAQVAADVDFTQVESTRELFDPDRTVVRSEVVSEDLNMGGAQAMGVPGALSNQPPAAGVAVPGAQLGAAEAAEAEQSPRSTSRRSTRNFEVDRTVSHVRQAPASLRRVSAAVVVDYRSTSTAEGIERQPLSEAELAHISSLVREAVGFDAERGDSVNVVSASFVPGPELEPVPEPEFWREPWFFDLVRQGAVALLALILVPLVLRPVLSNLSQQAAARPLPGLPGAGPTPAIAGATAGGATAALPPAASAAQPAGEDSLKLARDMVREDPKRVAQVVKQWVANDGNQ